MAIKIGSFLVMCFLLQREIVFADPFHFNVQQPVDPFVGRQDFLQNLHEALTRKGMEKNVEYSSITFVTGWGGIGKTETTRKYIQTYSDAFDNVIWIEAENELTVEKSFRALAQSKIIADQVLIELELESDSELETNDTEFKSGNPEQIDEKHRSVPYPRTRSKMTDETIQKIYKTLSRGKRTLMIFDNVDEIQQLLKFLPSAEVFFLNEPSDLFSSSHGESSLILPSILVLQTKGHISRGKRGQQMESAKWLHLGPFNDHDNINYILHHPKNNFHMTSDTGDMPEVKVIENARVLGQLLGGIPLALEQAMAFISVRFKTQPEKGLEKYLNLYKEIKDGANFSPSARSSRSTSEPEPEPVPEFVALNPIFLTWKITREKLAQEFGGNFTTLIMDSLPYFPSSKMSIRLVFYILLDGKDSKEFRDQSDHDDKAMLIKNAISTLHRYAIVNIDRDQSDPKVDLNLDLDFDLDLVNGTLSVHNGLQSAVLKNFKEQEQDMQFKLGKETNKYNRTAQYLLFHSLSFIDKIIEENGTLSVNELYSIAAILDGVDFTTHVLTGDTPDIPTLRSIAVARFKIALQFHKLDNFEGDQSCRKLLNHSLHQLGQIELKFEPNVMKVEFVSKIMQLVRNTFISSTKNDENGQSIDRDLTLRALKLQDILLEVASKIIGEDHPLRLTFLEEKADLMWRLDVDMDFQLRALALYDQVYEIKERVFGGESKQVISMLHKLAEIYYHLDDLSRSFELYSRVYDLEQKVYGSDYILSMHTGQRLAGILSQGGQIEQALDLLNSLVENHKIMDAINQLENCDTKSAGADGCENTNMDTNGTMSRERELHIIILHNVATHNVQLNNFLEAYNTLEKLYNIDLKFRGPDDKRTVAHESQMARALHSLHENEKAMKMQLHVHQVREKSLGPNHISTMDTKHDLARLYLEEGDLEKALELFTLVYDFRKENLGEETKSTLAAFDGIANVHMTLKNDELALEMKTRVYTLAKALYGDEALETINAQGDIALIKASLGPKTPKEVEETLKILKKVFKGKKTLFGVKNEQTLVALFQLCDFQAQIGEHKKALRQLEAALNIINNTPQLGPDSTIATEALHRMNRIYQMQGKHSIALKLSHQVLEISTRALGPEHPNTINAVVEIGSILISQENYKEALKYLSKAHLIMTEIYGPNHPKTLDNYENMGSIYMYNDPPDYAKASSIFRKIYKIRAQALGEQHPSALSPLLSIGIIENNVGNTDEAIVIFKRVLRGRIDAYGEKDERTLFVMPHLAWSYTLVKKFEEALKLYAKVYEGRKLALGEMHMNTLEILEQMSTCNQKLGNLEKALKLGRKVYEQRLQTLGQNHPKTKKSLEMKESLEAQVKQKTEL